MGVIQPKITRINSSATQSVVGSVVIAQKKINDKFYSSKLINHVEYSEISGYLKTVFYTEVNTNINVGDRIFIINGFYDSDTFNSTDKYRKFSDGYRVLEVDGCKVTLDIEYTGQTPYLETNSRDFIFVYHIKTQEEFEYFDALLESLDGTDNFQSPFSGSINNSNFILNGHKVVYASGSFYSSNISGPFIPSSGFWAKQGQWFPVDNSILANDITQNPEFSTNGKLYIIGEDFYFNDNFFQKGFVYKYENYRWVVDVTYKQPYLSKTNFRFGTFLGIHNDGVFGSNEKRAFWNGSTWNSGSFINSDWNSGIMNSKHLLKESSYLSKKVLVGSVSTVTQTIDFSDNKGFGYNFIQDSFFDKSFINNGNFLDCKFGFTTSATSSIDIFYGLTGSYDNYLNNGRYELSKMWNINSFGGLFLNSYVKNSTVNTTKVVNSELVDSTMKYGSWSNEGGISVLGADVWSYDKNVGSILGGSMSDIWGTLKLYISEEDFLKIHRGDVFYISKINKSVILDYLTDEQKIQHPIETRYLIDNYNDYEISPNKTTKMRVSLKSSLENKWKNYIKSSDTVASYYTNQIDDDPTYWYKIPNLLPDTIAQYRGIYSTTSDIEGLYILGDFVVDENNVFYTYYPYSRVQNTFYTIGQRARTQEEAETFRQGYLGQSFTPDPNYQFIDWVPVGAYSGVWSVGGSYSGFSVPSTEYPYYDPYTPNGDVVSDNDQYDNLWVFIGQDVDITLTNRYKQVLIGTDFLSQNYVTQSNVNLPSIDIETKLFGWYKDSKNNNIISKNWGFNPINPDNVDKVFSNTILGNGDFKSGLMSDSTWLSGDNINYFSNIIQRNSGNKIYYMNLLNDNSGNRLIEININNNNYKDRVLEGYDAKKDDYFWIQSVNYNYGLTSVSIDGRYKIVKLVKNTFASNQNIYLKPIDNYDLVSALPISGGYFNTPFAQSNNYLSVHKFLIKNSKIVTGKFKRTGLFNCEFQNDDFKKYENSGKDITNTELIRIINTLFSRTKNKVYSGIVTKSHFVDDDIIGATIYDSIWLTGTFSDGLFKFSVWRDGNFNGGKFVDSRDSTLFTFDYDSEIRNKLWQGGNFNGGEFYNSVWANGTFNNGRFYKSDWHGGIWNNGILGSKLLRTQDTTLAFYGPTSFGMTHTIWNNGVVENALVGGNGRLDWYDGKFLAGEFTSFDKSPSTYSTWHNGEFYSSNFTKFAWWKDGSFLDGKFLSEIGWQKPDFFTHSNDINDYGWVNGKFYGGEFGNGSTGTNSVWYGGQFYGGIFQGRFWRDGVLVNGKFYGSLATQSDISLSLVPFASSYYGLWNTGQVTDVASLVNPNELFFTKRDLQTTKSSLAKIQKKQLNKAEMFSVLWMGGRFANEIGTFNNSIWLDGEFFSGNFNSSYFNPFVDRTLSGLDLNLYRNSVYLKPLYEEINNLIDSEEFKSNPMDYTLNKIVNIVKSYNSNSEIDVDYITLFAENNTDGYQYTDFNELSLGLFTSPQMKIYDSRIYDLFPEDEYIEITFDLKPQSTDPNDPPYKDNSIIINYPGYNTILVPKYTFNGSASCVWTNGNFNSGQFNYSKWKGGFFNNGTINGAIWLNGIFNYGYMNNCYWENGTWRNGNWDGAPFDYKSIYLDSAAGEWVVSDKRTIDLIKNISSYSTSIQDKLHLSNVITQKGLSIKLNFIADAGFTRWEFDTNEDQN